MGIDRWKRNVLMGWGGEKKCRGVTELVVLHFDTVSVRLCLIEEEINHEFDTLFNIPPVDNME